MRKVSLASHASYVGLVLSPPCTNVVSLVTVPQLAMYSRKPYNPNQQLPGGQSDTAALFAALMTAAQSKNLAEAFKGVGQGLGKVAHDVLKQDKQGQNTTN